MSEVLALFGGEKAVKTANESLVKWPIYTAEEETAVLNVLRSANMSGTDITKKGMKISLFWCFINN